MSKLNKRPRALSLMRPSVTLPALSAAREFKARDSRVSSALTNASSGISVAKIWVNARKPL